MEAPDLQLLKSGNQAEWDGAYQWLWPTAFAVAKNKLFKYPAEVEDVAIASICKIIKHVDKVQRVEELKALLAKITHDECVGVIRKNLAQKHGGGKVESLDEILEEAGDQIAGSSESVDFAGRDMVRLIMGLAEQLKPKERLVFEEFHINGLSYEEISSKHDIPIGTVGVYLQRALETLRKLLKKKMKIFCNISETDCGVVPELYISHRNTPNGRNVTQWKRPNTIVFLTW